MDVLCFRSSSSSSSWRMRSVVPEEESAESPNQRRVRARTASAAAILLPNSLWEEGVAVVERVAVVKGVVAVVETRGEVAGEAERMDEA